MGQFIQQMSFAAFSADDASYRCLLFTARTFTTSSSALDAVPQRCPILRQTNLSTRNLPRPMLWSNRLVDKHLRLGSAARRMLARQLLYSL
jgi:hypothetical protein